MNGAVVCRNCRIAAPEIGDCGYIGHPSLDDTSGLINQMHTFGYLYAGFRALRLLTPELEDMRAFLKKHRRHSISLWLDGDEQESPDDLAFPVQEHDHRDRVQR